MQRQGWQYAGLVMVAALSAGCVKGVGEPCAEHLACLPGLACQSGKCAECGDGQACMPVDLVVKSCDPLGNPLEGVTTLRFTITGDDAAGNSIVLFTEVRSVGANELRLPAVPFGLNRRIAVEGLEAEGALTARSVGRSGPFNVLANTPVQAVVVYLRRSAAFGPADMRGCLGLKEPRAGHTATRLLDGTVLVVGGYRYNEQSKVQYLKSAEIYDPRTGLFTIIAAQLAVPRAGHTATQLPDGKVLIAGGTSLITQGTTNPITKLTGLGAAEIYDPARRSFNVVTMKKRRMRHAAAVLPNGVVMLSGGVEEPGGAPLVDTEFYTPGAGGTTSFQPGPTLSVGRADPASIAVDGDRVLVIGGIDATGAALDSVDVFTYFAETGTFQRLTTAPWQLGIGRSNPYAIPVNSGQANGVLVAGAPTGNQAESKAYDYLAVSEGAQPHRTVLLPPTPRKDACAGGFAGGAIVVGGSNPLTSALLKTTDAYTLVFPPEEGKFSARRGADLSSSRAKLACTALADGTVLVTGGDESAGTALAVSGAAEIYQPGQ